MANSDGSDVLSIRTHVSIDPDTVFPRDAVDSDDGASDEEIEPESVWAKCPDVRGYLTGEHCDVDQLVLEGYNVEHLLEDFPGSNFEFKTQVIPHRGLTDHVNTREGEGPHGSGETDLFFGILEGYQVVARTRHMSQKKVIQIKKYWATELSTNHDMYFGYVSPSDKVGVLFTLGGIVPIAVFQKLCFNSGISVLSLGRYGQKTPWALADQTLQKFSSKIQSVNIDVAFTFPVPSKKTRIPLFAYPRNASRTSLMFHEEGRGILNNKPVNFGMVRLDLPDAVTPKAPLRIDGSKKTAKITVYPNYFHAVRDVLNCEFQKLPGMMGTQKKGFRN